jgi:copper(I)-binding protein
MDENDVMRMGPIPNVEIPAGDSINLEPGGKHIMLLNLKQGLNPGDRITMTLTFQQTGSMIVEAEVRERDENLSMEHHFREHRFR